MDYVLNKQLLCSKELLLGYGSDHNLYKIFIYKSKNGREGYTTKISRRV